MLCFISKLYIGSVKRVMASSEKYAIHLLAGGIGGTVGAVVTCPLEVVKTRLQSSIYTPLHPAFLTNNAATCLTGPQCNVGIHTCSSVSLSAELPTSSALYHAKNRSLGLYYCLRHIVQTEGPHGLFKGLGPNLIGVAPSRAIYFFSYANMKKYLNTVMYPESPLVHILSAMTAGFASCTATNPIWFIKTRIQLDQKKNNSLTVRQCIEQIHRSKGIRGFYKGITASYFGITETVIHFVLYEAIKARLMQYSQNDWSDFLRYMIAGASSKTCATCIAYPHEVARTRLREEGNKYRSFFQTLMLVAKEEGYRGLYRGITTQLIRQIPNTAIMMSTYELVIYLCDGKHKT